MPCFGPWVSKAPGSYARALACGQCIGCRLEKSRQWAVRCMHEAQMHDASRFVTLTYAIEPESGSLDYSDFQRFMRRLRRKFPKVRFFMCGEYGEAGARPHFHACLFGLSFPDEVQYSKSLKTSALLSELWPHGFATIGDVTFESAAYVARYVVKKVNGDMALAHYSGRKAEFGQMSRRPGIGARWLDRFWSDVVPSGEVVVNGHKAGAPRFYLRRFRERNRVAYDRLQAERCAAAVEAIPDNTPRRLVSKQVVAECRLNLKRRVF